MQINGRQFALRLHGQKEKAACGLKSAFRGRNDTSNAEAYKHDRLLRSWKVDPHQWPAGAKTPKARKTA